MRTALALFAIAVICVAIAWWVSLLPGTVSATLAGTTIETTTPIAVTLAALLFLLIYLWIRFLAWLFSLPRRGRRWRERRARERGDVAVNRTLIALAANDAGAARREAERSRRLLGDTPVTLLLAAQAARQAGREEEAEAAFRHLAESRDGRLLGLRGLLRLALERRDWEKAARLAADAERVHPGAAWLRDERRFMAVQTGHWREALRLAPPDQKAALAVAAAEAESDSGRALDDLRQAFEADPALAPAAVAYARRLRERGRERAAQDVLRRAWSARPHPDIAEEYLAPTADKLQRTRELAVLLRANPEHVESRIAAARAALDAGLTGEARHQVELARQAGANQRRLWTLLADVAVLEGNAEAAQDALRHVPNADPDPIWRCTTCGTTHGRWHPVCEACQSIGTISWGTPSISATPRPRLASSPELVEGLAS
ncbi:MAG: heme biosynthesis protein HemY [Acetobacteraceae bacterium]|nr:heme biosynthesis protein HemY [Acetobacteraceae bacterium]